MDARGVQIRRDDVRPETVLRSDLGNRPGERPCRADKLSEDTLALYIWSTDITFF